MSTPSSTNADDASVGADTRTNTPTATNIEVLTFSNNPSTGNELRTSTTPTPAAGHTQQPQDQHQHATASGDEDSTGTAAEDGISAEEAEDSKTAKDGTSDASAGSSGKTQDPVPVDPNKVIRIMGFRQETQDYLNKECPTKEKLEVFLELSSEEIRAIKKGGEKDKEEKDKPRFKQTDRAKLILLGRWTENNRADDHDGKGIRWEIFKKKKLQ